MKSRRKYVWKADRCMWVGEVDLKDYPEGEVKECISVAGVGAD